MSLAKLVTTCFGIGYIQKGAGTIAALFCCLLWWYFKVGEWNAIIQLALLCLTFFAGVYASKAVEKEWGHDSNRVVIDEFNGMQLTLLLVPAQWVYILIGLVLFRLFDIAKPLGIRKMESLPHGWGVMLDDFLSGIYSAVLLQIIVKSHLFT